MPELVTDCPRCDAKKHTFIVRDFWPTHTEYRWQQHLEAYCVCKNCLKGTIFHLSQKNINDANLFGDIDRLYKYQGSINQIARVEGFINLRNLAPHPTPEHVPANIASIFQEGAQSVAGNCPNAAAAMFRLVIDLVTKTLLPPEATEGLNSDARKKLFNRLDWLFKSARLPHSLRELANCIREDGNDGAHDGTLQNEDVEDLLDFTVLLLDTVYTVPHRLEEAKSRRLSRRS